MSRKIYAWVKSETCTGRDAVKPGTRVGRNEELVSRHGDWLPWLWSQRETVAIVNGPATAANSYKRECARLVCRLLDWHTADKDHCDECGGCLSEDECICDPYNDEQVCVACGCNDGTCQHSC